MAAHANNRLEEEKRLLDHLPELPDLQCAWLLLYFSAAAQANRLLRVVPPRDVAGYAALHDEAMWCTLCKMLGLDPEDEQTAQERALSASPCARALVPHRLGGLGLRDACCTSEPPYWAAVADALPVLRQLRQPLAEHWERVGHRCPVGWFTRAARVP